MSEQDGEAEVRTGFSASCVQVLWGKKKPPNLLALSFWRVGEGMFGIETKGVTQLDPTCPYLLLSCKHQRSRNLFTSGSPSPSAGFSFPYTTVMHCPYCHTMPSPTKLGQTANTPPWRGFL